jgi:hypothetical protein
VHPDRLRLVRGSSDPPGTPTPATVDTSAVATSRDTSRKTCQTPDASSGSVAGGLAHVPVVAPDKSCSPIDGYKSTLSDGCDQLDRKHDSDTETGGGYMSDDSVPGSSGQNAADDPASMTSACWAAIVTARATHPSRLAVILEASASSSPALRDSPGNANARPNIARVPGRDSSSRVPTSRPRHEAERKYCPVDGGSRRDSGVVKAPLSRRQEHKYCPDDADCCGSGPRTGVTNAPPKRAASGYPPPPGFQSSGTPPTRCPDSAQPSRPKRLRPRAGPPAPGIPHTCNPFSPLSSIPESQVIDMTGDPQPRRRREGELAIR